MKNEKLQACLITTDKDKRGVFMGYVDPSKYEEFIKSKTVHAADVRMCVYWSQEVRGVIGLAATGPTKNCKITRAGPKGILDGVTAIIEISKEAEKEWLKDYWAE